VKVLGAGPPPGEENPPLNDSASLVGEESKRAGIESLPARLERYGKAHLRRKQMVEYLRTIAVDPDSRLSEASKMLKRAKRTVDLRKGLKTLSEHAPAPALEAIRGKTDLRDRRRQSIDLAIPEWEQASIAADKLCTCGSWLQFRHYYTVDELKLIAGQFCQQTKLCVFCAIRKSSRQLGVYLERFKAVILERPKLVPYLITWTVRNGPNLEERILHLRRSFKTFSNRGRQARSGNGWGKTEARKIAGLIGSFEVTENGNGWHPHLHAICLCEEEPDKWELSREWRDITGDSYIIDVRPIDLDDPVNAFCEVFKYALKFQDMSCENNWRAHLTLKRFRMLVSQGCFYGIPEPAETDDPLEDLPFVDYFYQYLEKSGTYTLKREKEQRAEKASGECECTPVPPAQDNKKTFTAGVLTCSST
jgi:hypothetical protein